MMLYGWRKLQKIPQLTRILLLIFLLGSIGVWWFSLEAYFLLVPGLTISNGYAWNVFSFSLVDVPLMEMGLLLIPLGIVYSMFENSWGVIPFVLFWIFVSVTSAFATIVLLFVLYTFLRDETLLYVPLSGSMAILGGFLVAVKQLIPDHEIYILPRRFRFRLIANDMPFWFLLCFSLGWLSGFRWIGQWFLSCLGVINSWIYLRYLQKREYGREWILALFPSSSNNKEHDTASYSRNLIKQDNDILPVTTTDPTEAERRRQRALRALDERLGSLKSHSKATTSEEGELV
ncbi:Rhomboid-like protein 19 [Galdieria sulphuraria]|nr:Rhomboid-like protein 19 [Galdieria sulphuraria]